MSRQFNQVLMIVGPAGSGKTTLSDRVAHRLGWQHFEEDSYWLKNGWRNERRTVEREKIVQQHVLADIQKVCKQNKSAVLELLLYKDLPNSLTVYIDFLNKNLVPYHVIALKPTPEEILDRIKKRGRKSDVSNLDASRKSIESQLTCLDADYIKSWVIDSTSMSVDELVDYSINLVKA